MVSVLRALILPERAMREQSVLRVSRAVLLIALFLMYLAGSELIALFYANPYVAALNLQDQSTSSSRFVFGGSRSGGSNQNQGSPNGGRGPAARFRATSPAVVPPVVQAVQVVIQSGFFVLSAVVTRLLLAVFVPFLGGEEAHAGGVAGSGSRYLVYYAWMPLALRRFAQGIVIHLQNPADAWNALSYASYRSQSAVSFSVFSLLNLYAVPAPLLYLLYSLTDPFYLWTLYIIVLGGGAVYRLSRKASFVAAGFVFLLLFLYQLLPSAGGSTGV